MLRRIRPPRHCYSLTLPGVSCLLLNHPWCLIFQAPRPEQVEDLEEDEPISFLFRSDRSHRRSHDGSMEPGKPKKTPGPTGVPPTRAASMWVSNEGVFFFF